VPDSEDEMKKLFAKFAGFPLAFIPLPAILICASALWAGAPAPLTTLRAIHALSHAEAGKEPPAAFEATVTYRAANETSLFVEDGDAGIYVWAKANLKLAPGDRVLIQGRVQDSFRPIVHADNVTVLRHGALPQPVPATFDELMRDQYDCMRVAVHAVVHSADRISSSGHYIVHLYLHADGGTIDTWVNSSDSSALQELLDAEVVVTGTAGAKFDGKMQQVGVGLSVPSIVDVRILKRAGISAWSLPVTQMDKILSGFHVTNSTPRIRVQGTITYYQPGSALVLQSGAKSLWIMTHFEEPVRVGSQASVTGFPDLHDGFLILNDGEIQERPVYAPIPPRPVTRRQLTSSKDVFDLVSIEGQVVMEVRQSAQDEYVLVSDGQLFSAIYRHPGIEGLNLPPMKQIPLGARIRVTGICILEDSNPFDHEVPFDILLRSFDDIAVVARPSLLTVRNLTFAVGLLLFIVFAVGARSWSIERRARQQTAALASIERRRSRILEDINGARPLAEIIEQITELVSFRLKGAPCWCQIAGGALLGNCPKNLPALRILRQEIPARSGPPLGEIFAAFNPQAKFHSIESESISVATALAALAIETRRLYSDLVRRSEFDLLTDIHNRFSLEKHLDALIEEARRNAGIFGLIYIDLDEFKQVNDVYGHRVGDLYLQEVAMRMKRQLRSHDMLARLGGDEFAVLVSMVRSRAVAEEIAHRLELCFDEPFPVEGYVLHGSASVGLAIYPEDGSTRDSLLSASDAAMYVSKHTKHTSGRLPADQRGFDSH
jgi:diguanylate cyclase (GGDEF)-like protein